MKKTNLFTAVLLFLCFQINVFAQVGIGTTNPNASAILDMESTTQGVLTPRMETADRLLITSPAEGLLVFDTDENSFYFYDGTSWVALEGAEKRDNHKLIKSAADLADELVAGGGTEYLLTTDYTYEINGTISLAVPINLNGAYLYGEDTNEDILVRAGGAIFEGDTGGSIRGVTLVASGGGAAVFNISGSTGTERLIFRDCVVANSTSVGSISSCGLVFVSIVQYVNNAAGITYTDIDQLLLNSEGWASDNVGIYQTFTGTFDIIAKQGGFSKVVGATAAIDITAISTLTSGNISNVNFYGGGNYINGTSPYPGHNFPNTWDVNSPGILVETDGVATGNFYFDGGLSTGFSQTTSSTSAVEVQGTGTFTANSLFRFTAAGGGNRLIYDGRKEREFQISASMSIRVNTGGSFYAFMLAKNGSVIVESNSVVYIDTATQIQNVSINANIDLSPTDYIEVYVQRLTGTGSYTLSVFSENLSIK